MRAVRMCVLLAVALSWPLGQAVADEATTDSSKASQTTKKKTSTKKKTDSKSKAKPKPKPKKKKPAEPKRTSKWGIGLTGGVNIASLSGDEDERIDSKAGFHVNLELLYEFNRYFQAQTGLGYTTKGFFTETKTGNTTTETTVSLSYVEIPAMIRLVMDDWSIKPFLHGGLYLGFLVSSEWEDKISVEGETRTDTSSRTQEVPEASTFDYGLKIGLGVEYAFNPNVSLVAQFDYVRSFADALDESRRPALPTVPNQPEPAEGEDTGTARAKDFDRVNSVFQIGAGALFRW